MLLASRAKAASKNIEGKLSGGATSTPGTWVAQRIQPVRYTKTSEDHKWSSWQNAKMRTHCLVNETQSCATHVSKKKSVSRACSRKGTNSLFGGPKVFSDFIGNCKYAMDPIMAWRLRINVAWIRLVWSADPIVFVCQANGSNSYAGITIYY